MVSVDCGLVSCGSPWLRCPGAQVLAYSQSQNVPVERWSFAEEDNSKSHIKGVIFLKKRREGKI